ncbi:MAG TPA: C25 family cysteine peptidase, partial [Caldilineaceae bacterium]|nr:C25 family cysteine peptidase [Caldilineaceae bacterium]
LEYGRWRANIVYNSTVAGADGDHWFHLSATVDPAQGDAQGFTASLAHRLPLFSENGMEVTLHLSALNVRPGLSGDCSVVYHRLRVEAGGFVQTDDGDDWPVDFAGDCKQPQNLTRTYRPSQPADSLTVTLLPAQDKVQALFDAIDYRLPVSLDFGGKGAIFAGVDGSWRYQLSNLPPNSTLYDITDPLRPVIVTLPDGASFQDGPQARRYLLSGEGVVWTPRVAAHAPVDFGPPGAHTVYIAPASLQPALQPLVAWRRSQGYTVAVVTPQAIYDAWSDGRVDPRAIRSFLRYVVGNWSPAPIAAVLVGDGTWDPWNYLGHNNPNHIPPFLAEKVDPWLNETACDNCYGQLDGDDPLAESAFLLDIWIGRFPVADAAELQAVVKKIVDYEQATDTLALWRRRSLQLVDDYVRPDGEIDNAGNFPQFVEGIIRLMPPGVQVIRNYFSGVTDLSRLNADLRAFIESLAPWFITDPDDALQRTIQQMNGGVGLVTFTGHSNHWQWARLAASSEPNSDKRMMGLWDVEQLHNRTMPFIALSMTCYTSQFPIPAPYHFTLDEHLFLHDDGGAVAVWGPAGLGVAHGHDALQKGFYQVLWSSPRLQAKLGALTQGGYSEILRSSPCCIDINRTFLLLGDPLTPARVDALPAVQFPIIQAKKAR